MFGSVIAYSFCLESSYKHRTLYGRQFAGSDNQMLGKYMFAKHKLPFQHDRVRKLLNELDNKKSPYQGCISCGILVSGIQARGVSAEHMENMEMFSYSPT